MLVMFSPGSKAAFRSLPGVAKCSGGSTILQELNPGVARFQLRLLYPQNANVSSSVAT
jgi:hypothetical protein